MIKGFDSYIRRFVIGFLLVAGVINSLHSQGTRVHGIINSYMHVVSIGGLDNVTVTDASGFNVRDTVLLIQMKGTKINVPELSSYGLYQESLGSPGSYEFLIVESVNTTTDNIVFTSNLVNAYDIEGVIQLIKIPSYTEATVDAELTCQPWDSISKTGGVLAMIIEKNLSLENNINVSGMGFAGGTALVGQGICTAVNPALYDKFSYPDSYSNSGFKGEGIAIKASISLGNEPSLFPGYAKGKGANFTAGGGGNGRFAGGGGGAGWGAGGIGGVEISTCGAGNQGGSGVGGRQRKNTELSGKLLFGSGGGSSTYEAGSTSTSGARGGGIVIILCDTLKGNGKAIWANGATPSLSSSGNAGAGGGGGGGSIALYQQSFSVKTSSSALTISANGGRGGNANNPFGEGGGGGGGLILTNNLTVPSNVVKSVTGGAVGSRTGGSIGGTAGQIGETLTSFAPVLNGFLYNTIRSSLTDNQLDSVCSNIKPPRMIGSNPVGGMTPYTFTWQKSYNEVFSSPVNLIIGPDSINYTPGAIESATVYFRRIVTDSSTPTNIIDISKPVKFIVHTAIQNNNVGNPDTICLNGNPPLIQQLMPDLIVPSTDFLSYTWQDSSLSGTWGSVVSTDKNYDPPAGLGRTTWFRRTVKSGRCTDVSPKVKIEVLPVISGNSILSQPQEICYGDFFNNLSGSVAPALTGGDNSFRYKWISSINGSAWNTASGTSTQSNYNPEEQSQRVPSNEYYFRRIVYSGSNNVCFDTTLSIHLRDFPVISNNTISYTDANPICAGSAPGQLTGSAPSGGSTVYTYAWYQSTNGGTSWALAAGTNTLISYQPPVLEVTTIFRRVVTSSTCTNTSNSITITVHPRISNNIISLVAGSAVDTTICYGQTPHRFIGTAASGGNGIYSYHWQSALAEAGPFVNIAGVNQINYPNPGPLNVTTYFKRQVTSGACLSESDATISVIVLQDIGNYEVSAGQSAVCENSTPEPISGSALTGGSGTYVYSWEQSSNGGISWSPAEGTNTTASYQPPPLSQPMKYRRLVKSGLADCCIKTSAAVDIGINPAPDGPAYAGADTSIYSMERNFTLRASAPVVSGETGFWTVSEPGTGIIDEISNNHAEVRNLSSGSNLLIWTITNGLCNLTDSVYIELLHDFIPQGFSPNGDNWNNSFIIEGLNLSDQQTADLSILNGAGTVVFSTSNRDDKEWVNWDGKNTKGNELPEGTYYYLLKLTTKEKKVIRKSGFIILKRY